MSTIKMFTPGEIQRIEVNSNKSYIIHGKAVVDQDFTHIYTKEEDLLPHDGLLPYDGVYPAYKVILFNANNQIIRTDLTLLGAGVGVYDMLHKLTITASTKYIEIETVNCDIVELYYNEVNLSGIIYKGNSGLRFKENNYYQNIINAWCKIDGTWRMIRYIYLKQKREYKQL
ncbi:MAG: hypothetical protein K0Q47_148 [Sedimentibacter sp.]|jgi:hypothetical protein|nr:hypothetical protein [Sedimentibacter sp.]